MAISQQAINAARKVFDNLIDSSDTKNLSEYNAYCFARDIFEYTLANNTDKLEALVRLTTIFK
ncbi:MAG: hypothetical protein II388_04700 [Clostridia bacterium]|nr:hypothetical protein [Clostridia bacterium]